MRIALLDNRIQLDGAQRFLVDLARGLLSRKWEVLAIVAAQGVLAESCAALQLPVELLHIPVSGCHEHPPASSLAGWRLVTQLCGILHRQHIDVLYANSSFTAFWGGIAARVMGVPLVWRVYQGNELTQRRLRSSLALHLATQIHLATETMRLDLPHAGQLAEVRVLPPAIDLDRYTASAPPVRKRQEVPLVGMVAPWQPCSGQEVLLRAVRFLQEGGGGPLRLCLVGKATSVEDERYRSVVMSAVKAAGLGERVKIRERVDDLSAFLAGCDLVAIPTLGETTGRLALEAAAIGRPVIASRMDALNGIILDGRTGLLVPPNQPQALADALALLLASPALCIQMGRQARVRCEELFTLNASLAVIENMRHHHQPKSAV